MVFIGILLLSMMNVGWECTTIFQSGRGPTSAQVGECTLQLLACVLACYVMHAHGESDEDSEEDEYVVTRKQHVKNSSIWQGSSLGNLSMV